MSQLPQITSALTSLLPPTTVIPPKLLSATDSLLSLSRRRAPHLKPDEEIARTHACAEIACRRLRASLRLPNIRSGKGAPCRPGVYGKLVGYLEGVLGDLDGLGTPGTPRTPGGRKRKSDIVVGTLGSGNGTGGRKRGVKDLDNGGGEEEEGEVETPSKKRRTGDCMGTPTKSTGKKSGGFVGRIERAGGVGGRAAQEETPVYVLPSIRKLCKAFKTPKMIPHVYTGVAVVLSLSGQWPTDLSVAPGAEEDVRQKQDVLSLVIAVYLLTLTRMQKGLMTGEIYDGVSKRSVEVLDMEEEAVDVQTNIEDWIGKINDSDWTAEGKGGDWWGSVPEDVLASLKLSVMRSAAPDAAIEDEDEDDEETPNARQRSKRDVTIGRQSSRKEELLRQLEEEDPEDVLLPGLGTWMNDALDYFSEDRMVEYEQWEADIRRRIDAIEKGGTPRKGRAIAAVG